MHNTITVHVYEYCDCSFSSGTICMFQSLRNYTGNRIDHKQSTFSSLYLKIILEFNQYFCFLILFVVLRIYLLVYYPQMSRLYIITRLHIIHIFRKKTHVLFAKPILLLCINALLYFNQQ